MFDYCWEKVAFFVTNRRLKIFVLPKTDLRTKNYLTSYLVQISVAQDTRELAS